MELKLIDIVKIFFAICVIAIHTFFLQDLNNDLYFYNLNIILFNAVPFFFITSGYFLGKKIKNSTNNKWNFVKKTEKNLFFHYIFWGTLYLFISCTMFMFLHEPKNSLVILKAHLLGNPNAAMWYLPSLIVSIVLVIIMDKNKKMLKISIIISLIILLLIQLDFLIIGYFNNTYIEKLTNFFAVENRTVFFNVIYYAYFFVALGFYLGKYKDVKGNIKLNVLLIFLGILLNILLTLVELNLVSPKINIQMNIPLGSIIIALNLFLICLKFDSSKIKFDTKIIRKMSSTVYYSHYFFLIVSKVFLEYILKIKSNTILFIITSILTIGCSFILNKIKNDKFRYIV